MSTPDVDHVDVGGASTWSPSVATAHERRAREYPRPPGRLEGLIELEVNMGEDRTTTDADAGTILLGRRAGTDNHAQLGRLWPRGSATAKAEFDGDPEEVCGVRVRLLESPGAGKHGGVVLRIEAAEDRGYLPHAVVTEDGVELHVAGEAEAEAFIVAMRAVLAAWTSARPSGLVGVDSCSGGTAAQNERDAAREGT